MRNIFILFFLSVTLCQLSCSKKDNGCGYQDDNVVAPVSEQQMVKAYLDSVGITATLDSNGFYYVIVKPGSGVTPGLCSAITVNYKGQLITGSIFDQQYNFVYTLGALIDGWKKGLPHIKNGGEIRLYIPPSLGYGSKEVDTGNNMIPANSILIFDINLLNVQ
jgi:FKBP-type peptidyl-prolyl cis-trans isomerase FkpA